jgi:precorrin isomerase
MAYPRTKLLTLPLRPRRASHAPKKVATRKQTAPNHQAGKSDKAAKGFLLGNAPSAVQWHVF